MIERTTQPAVLPVEHIDFVKPHIFDVTEHVRLLWMKDVPNDTVRLDLFFDAGIIRGNKSIPAIVHSLLFSGTAEKSSVEIHESIDALGGFLDTDLSFETAVVSIYCLRENLDRIALLVGEAINGLAFRESEVEDTLRSMGQKFRENQQKVRNVGQQQFRRLLFESHEDYSTLAAVSDFDSGNYAAMKRFFKDHYLNGLTRITLVGNVEQDSVDALIDLFGKWAMDHKPVYGKSFGTTQKKAHFPVDGAVQTAIRMGKMMFPKNHPDYIGFQFLNTILGDYFGSRLMSNIREDKGYTYGIGSVIMELHNDGYLVIVTEVGKDVTEATLTEIKSELKRLQEEPVPAEELELVRNYMLGQLLKSADGPYAMLDMYNSVDMYGIDLGFYDRAIAEIRAMQPERLQQLAKTYLDWHDFLIVTAG
ncbi:MAG TPA: pitrilysin family protein [Fluviicola sp.]|nr:pitrilysin family protein [Fluviicola sp.]